MPRKLKTDSPTGVYHWITRGINRQGIFHKRQDYNYFLDLVKEYNQSLDISVYHYCLMTNHIHMLIHGQSKDDVSDYSHFIKRRYAYYISKTYKSCGSVFQRMYTSIPVEDDRYLLECGRYIERNPVRALLTKTPAEYSYSSYLFYSEGKESEILTYSPAFLALAETMDDRRRLYVQYVTETRPQEEYANTKHLGF